MWQLHVEQIKSGRWALFLPDGTKFDLQSYKTYAAARRAMFYYDKN